tara:strand:- start:157 stop:441 length:285 start_codon:yes stop_codon:yes gene_type:complete
MAERFNAPVLKTDVLKGTGGSNPSFSAAKSSSTSRRAFLFCIKREVYFRAQMQNIKVINCRLMKDFAPRHPFWDALMQGVIPSFSSKKAQNFRF